ncbi:MAG: VCBS repeat-containing protein [Bacteroidota bacterium]
MRRGLCMRIWWWWPLLLIHCDSAPESSTAPTLFNSLAASRTGIDFVNELTDTKDLNILNYLYYYNGGGIAVGDVNQDGLPDLFFTANQLSNRLYLNQGNLQFKDITETAGVGGKADWSTGVSMADVNGDGRLDIYVSNVSEFLGLEGHNELFLNQGVDENGLPRFEESAERYGLALTGFSTQGAFFDYDNDGDLDLFQLNHSIDPARTVGDTNQRAIYDPLAGDKLLRNDGQYFTDVSRESGIIQSRLGYGLNIVVGDIDQNGCPDIYVCNDFHEDDYLYLNQCDGSFRESLREKIGHTSRFSMGSDLADQDQDGQPEILTLDMKPWREDILKTSEPPEAFDIFQYKLSFGYYHQYPRNALQWNQGEGKFSEVAQLSGIDATDWSWSALLCDLDNDGLRDIFITNGIYRRPNDMDYLKFISRPDIIRQLNGEAREEQLAFVQEMPSVPIPNRAYRNLGQLNFEESSAKWGLDTKGFSNGAAYADLDLDGDLDLVVNHLNAPAGVYENTTDSSQNAFRLKLTGRNGNTAGLGSKIWLWANGQMQYQELYPVRGFLSSVEARFHIGLGQTARIDSLHVLWADGHSQKAYDLPANQFLEWSQDDSETSMTTQNQAFTQLPTSTPFQFVHKEDDWNDFQQESLMPHQLSTQGPCLASADVDGNGLDDVFIGGAHLQFGRLWLQFENGWREAETDWEKDLAYEDVDAVFFDADGDGDQDLYVVSGGNRYPDGSDYLQDRLYLNDGKAGFSVRLMPVKSNGSCIAAHDWDGDGDLDLFVGSRSMPGAYGLDAPAYWLENEGKGNFIPLDIDGPKGMITDAVWIDLKGDARKELVVVGEWMEIEIWQLNVRRQNGKGHIGIKKLQTEALANSSGWWNTIYAADLDGDGDEDLAVGNLGLNSGVKASPQEPCTLYVSDFDGNGATEPILCDFNEGKSYPMASRDEMIGQMVSLRKKYPDYKSYARQQIADIFDTKTLDLAVKKEAVQFASVWVENGPGDQVHLHELPRAAQLAPVFAFVQIDVDGDGQKELILGGNFYGVGPARGRYDASHGLVLDRQNGVFEAKRPHESHLWLEGEIRAFTTVRQADQSNILIVARNNDSLQFFYP